MTDSLEYLSNYNPLWPQWFELIETYLRERVSGFLSIEHVGSTSVPGMTAKPIIDIDIVVEVGTMSAMIAALSEAGYTHRGDQGVVGREAFKQVGELAAALPAHHLYACEANAFEHRKHISFREYLKAFPKEAETLSNLKRRLAWEDRVSRADYIAAKSQTVQEISGRALEWYTQAE